MGKGGTDVHASPGHEILAFAPYCYQVDGLGAAEIQQLLGSLPDYVAV